MPLNRSVVLILSTIIATVLGISFLSAAHRPAIINKAILVFPSLAFAQTSSMTSPISGFLDRAEPYDRPTSEFKPPRSAIELVVLRNTPVEPEGFTLAIFASDSQKPPGKKHYAVDTQGRILVLQDKDVAGIQDLVSKVVELPQPDRWGNTWALSQPRTSQPIERILIPTGRESEFDEIGVQGFDGRVRELKVAVGGFAELPDVLWDLTEAAMEARVEGGERDEDVLGYVRGLLGNVF